MGGDAASALTAWRSAALPGLTPTPFEPALGFAQSMTIAGAGVAHRVTAELEETGHLNAADIVERVKARGLLVEPGSAELYSSAGFTCLARVVEIVESKPFDSVLADRMFRPASVASAVDEIGRQLRPCRALPYVLQGDR